MIAQVQVHVQVMMAMNWRDRRKQRKSISKTARRIKRANQEKAARINTKFTSNECNESG